VILSLEAFAAAPRCPGRDLALGSERVGHRTSNCPVGPASTRAGGAGRGVALH